MQRVFQGIVGLMAVAFAAMAGIFLFDPLAGAAQFAVAPEGVRGLNTLRGDLGGLFLAAAVLLGCGLWWRQTLWFLAVAVMMAAIAFGRLFGFVVDGWAGNSLPEFFGELLIIAVLVLAHRSLRER
jgi:hypothetical protein